ncbi:site-specific integrase [Lentibacillus jeotgali]|uniref:site-specific integrase n=1 Tax=Lentibacillus jeotgali TaxID=558169 RepID=UPI00030B59A3|nr:site-specific integrase [Lentibacillus jeotgali]
MRKHLNYAESEKLIQYLMSNLENGLTYYLLLLGIVSGLHFGELVGLTGKDFDFEQNVISVDRTWRYLKSGFGETKNEQSVRVISINPKTMVEFKKLFMQMPDNLNRLVFYSQASKYEVVSNSAANNVLKQAADTLNINQIMVHGLRHTHANILQYKKASMNYVSERLGHEDIGTTWKTYSHLMEERREKDERITIDTFERLV